MEDTRALKAETGAGLMVEAAEMAVAAGLVYVSDSDPGIRRLRQGDAFAYVRPDDRPLAAAAELARIARLAIPPRTRAYGFAPTLVDTSRPRDAMRAAASSTAITQSGGCCAMVRSSSA